MYKVNEVFYSVQGEGMRAGTANVFCRFSGCNLQCSVNPGPKSPGGFDCDTEFASGREYSREDLVQLIWDAGASRCGWVILTGGEPALQVDLPLLYALQGRGIKVAIETNGSMMLPTSPELNISDPDTVLKMGWVSGRIVFGLFDWITVSPKVAEHAVRQLVANEVRYVRSATQGLPKTRILAKHKLLSPAFNGQHPEPGAVDNCIELVKQNPEWRLSVQLHKTWGVL